MPIIATVGHFLLEAADDKWRVISAEDLLVIRAELNRTDESMFSWRSV